MHYLRSFLFSPHGTLSRRQFLFAGLLLFVLKYFIDLVVVRQFLDRDWLPWDYFSLRWRNIDFNDPSSVRFSALMLALAIPFIWVGVVLTLKRLRSAGWRLSHIWLFFIPYVNLAFFLALSVAPDVPESTRDPAEPDGVSTNVCQSGLVISAVTILVAVSVVVLAASTQTYGWGLFVGLPFVLGFIPGLLYRAPSQPGCGVCFRLSVLIQCILAALLLAFAIEGVFCLLMAAPLSLVLSGVGTIIGYSIRSIRPPFRRRAELCSFGLLLVPGVIFVEHSLQPAPSLIKVKTALLVQAPPQRVWTEVIQFSELPPPTEWMFRAGIAYPIRAEIQGSGVGAVRHCVFSTGSFIEPIEVWDEPNLLRFTVTSNPPPMRELSPYKIDPPHLHGFLVSTAGQFKLTRLAGDRTLLEGTTWYHHTLWPERYWQLWSDQIIHTIHLRVLNHIKDLSESSATSLR